jgi:hypothetical protein
MKSEEGDKTGKRLDGSQAPIAVRLMQKCQRLWKTMVVPWLG